MTIIEPNKNKFRFNFTIAFIASFTAIEIVFGIFIYSQNVSVNYQLTEKNKIVENFQAQNADLKNRLYTILDFQNVDQLADQLGLIKERKPDYLVRQ